MANWKNFFNEGKELVLATCSKKAKPHANIVISLGFIDGELLVADCQMKTTARNLRENREVCIVGGYYRLKGKVKLFSSGKYFDLCVKKSKGYKVNNAILVDVEEVFDLNKGKGIL
jgi:hypothetical protein